jgi:hypothetical protein
LISGTILVAGLGMLLAFLVSRGWQSGSGRNVPFTQVEGAKLDRHFSSQTKGRTAPTVSENNPLGSTFKKDLGSLGNIGPSKAENSPDGSATNLTVEPR